MIRRNLTEVDVCFTKTLKTLTVYVLKQNTPAIPLRFVSRRGLLV